MRHLVMITLVTILSLGLNAQEVDTKAKAILDKLSSKTKAYKTIKAEFQYTISNESEGINESQKGSIDIKGDKYYLSIQGQDIISNGEYMFTVLKESEEVHINNLPEEGEEDYISPNKIFTLYEDGFKYKFVKEQGDNQVINLYPKDAEEKSFHRVELFISKSKTQITKVNVYGKDGSNFTYRINKFSPNTSIADTRFMFDKAKFAKYETIDLRD